MVTANKRDCDVDGSIDAWHTGQNLRNDLIIDGTQAFRDLFGAHSGLALATNQDHLVTHPRLGNVSDIDHALVHADTTEQGSLPFVYQDRSPVLRGSSKAIGVPHWENCDAGGTFCDIGTVVANAFARRH